MGANYQTIDLLPAGDGHYTDFTASGCANEWECIDDPVGSPDDNATYLRLSSLTGRQSVTFDSFGIGSKIYWVDITTRTLTSPASPAGSGVSFIRIGGTDYEASPVTLTTSYVSRADRWLTNPATGLDWTQSDIDSLEAGWKYTPGGLTQGRITQLFATVRYRTVVEIQCNGTALDPQPAEANWETTVVSGKLDGSDAIGSYETLILRAPVDQGGTAYWNWGDYENQVLSSLQAPARFDTMHGTAVTYNSGVVAKRISRIDAPPGGLVRGVEMRIMVVI